MTYPASNLHPPNLKLGSDHTKSRWSRTYLDERFRGIFSRRCPSCRVCAYVCYFAWWSRSGASAAFQALGQAKSILNLSVDLTVLTLLVLLLARRGRKAVHEAQFTDEALLCSYPFSAVILWRYERSTAEPQRLCQQRLLPVPTRPALESTTDQPRLEQEMQRH